MTGCPMHPQRRRKGCEVCYGLPLQSVETIRRFPYPHVTEDGMTWLDPDGNPPKVDKDGKLAESFVLELRYGARERWGVGLKLPDTPEAFRRFAAEYEAARARVIKHTRKERD